MTTNTESPEPLPEAPLPGQHGPTPPSLRKSKKRGLIWVIFLLIVAGVAGYAVWRASRTPALEAKAEAGEALAEAAAGERLWGRCR